jgi:RNA 2',3'-cyclic 3'-phosphodiesterase
MARGTARLFVAVDVPVSEREELAEWGREAARAVAALGEPRTPPALRPVPVESIHLTLCFLGGRPAAEIDTLAEVLPACAEHACELRVGAPVWLPRRRPRALAAAVADESGGELERLHAQLRDGLAQAVDWQPERRRFRAHITLARVRGGGRRRRREEHGGAGAHGAGRGGPDAQEELSAVTLPATPGLVFAPESITLYRSRLDPAGARYDALASARLLPPRRDG